MTTILDEQDTATDDLAEATGSDALAARETQVRTALIALRESEVQIMGLLTAVRSIRMMLPGATEEQLAGEKIDVEFVPFSHVGKEIRNSMLTELHTNLASVEDSIKATWRAAKAVKRSRLNDEQIDRLIMQGRMS